jgi:hypothetical protein
MSISTTLVSFLTYYPEYSVVTCIPCKTAIPVRTLFSHLTYTYYYLQPKIAKAYLAALEPLLPSLPYDYKDFTRLPDGSPPLPFLQGLIPGFSCLYCPKRFKNCTSLQAHLN